jgi:peptidoglycan/LPS O-acetylase OafA/YrhL
MELAGHRNLRQDRSQQDLPAYFNCIDAVRVLAALAVVVFHYHHFYLADQMARPDIPARSSFPYASLLGPLFAYGHMAVELFWVISGFVFTHVYLRAPTTLGRFAMTRFARLYPLHFATLLIVMILQWVSLNYVGHWQIYGNNTTRYFLFQLILGSHWTNLSLGLSFNGPIWSVSLEIGAYFLFFFALATLRRFRVWAALALVSLCWGLRVWPGTTLPLIQMGVFTCAGYFFCGVTLYFVFSRFAARPAYLVGIAGCFAAAGLVSLTPMLRGWTEATFSCAVVLLAGLLDMRLGEAGSKLRSVGNISYSLYLIHVPLQMGVLLSADVFFGGTRAFAMHPLTLPAYLIGSICCAIWAFRYFERPAGRYCRQWLPK